MERFFPQIRFEEMWEDRNRAIVQMVSGAIVLLIALVDWWTKPYVSLGFLYLFPVMFVAVFLPRWAVVLLAAGCAYLAEVFSSLEPSLVRLCFETLALAGCGLFVAELVRNRRLTLQAEARLQALVETSPAAIVTVDESGFVELSNRSAIELMAPRDGKLAGAPIAAFLPELHHALQWRAVNQEEAPHFRRSIQCHGHRGNEESFTADVWFSTYKEGSGLKLAAIIGEITEESQAAAAFAAGNGREQIGLNTRELGVLRLLVEGLANKEIAARMEVSESTIKNSLQQLFAKTNVRTRAQLVRIAYEHYREDSAPSRAPAVRSSGLGAEARRMLSARYATRRSEAGGTPDYLPGQPA